MAHDFGIKNKTKNGELAYFFGYLNGFLYKALRLPFFFYVQNFNLVC